jgi:SAM-dependent methyltransferase
VVANGRIPTVPAYGDDLAYIHDAGFRDYSLRAAPGLLAILRRHGVRSGLVVDLGCGSGRWARELTRSGYRVLGVDRSAAMIRLARRVAPAGRFIAASFFDAELPPCDAVTSIGECLGYAVDPRQDAHRLSALFGRVYAALRPGGVFAFDLMDPERVIAPRTAVAVGRDWAVVSRTERSRDVLTRRITSFRRIGGTYRRNAELHRLRLYRAGWVAAALERAGFAVERLAGYGRFRLPAQAAFLARKSP